MEEPREYTADEVTEMFLKHIWGLVGYWEGKYDHKVALMSCREKLEGLAFSILVTLDGESCGVPGFIVAPCPHESDREFHKERGENWYPENHETRVYCDIGGDLHHSFHRKED